MLRAIIALDAWSVLQVLRHAPWFGRLLISPGSISASNQYLWIVADIATETRALPLSLVASPRLPNLASESMIGCRCCGK